MMRHLFCFGLALLLACNPYVSVEAAQSAGTDTRAPVVNIAHRGARSVAPENTLSAFQIGVQRCGADMIELDVHLSKDGVPVVVHDDTLERCSDVAQKFPDRAPWRVGDFSLAELLTLDAGAWFVEKDPFGQIAAGNVPESDVEFFRSGRVRLPTLRAVLLWAKTTSCLVNIELKNFPAYYAGLSEKVLEVVRRTEMADRVVFSSFDHATLVEMRHLAPDIPRAALLDQPVFPFVPYITEQLGAVAVNPDKLVLGFDSLNWHRFRRIRTDFLAAARGAGLAVFVWTVNDQEQMKVLVDAGVAGIFTDFPQLLRPLVKR